MIVVCLFFLLSSLILSIVLLSFRLKQSNLSLARRATRMSSTDTWNGYIISQPKQIGSLCSFLEEVDIICPQVLLVQESDDLDKRDLSSDRKWPMLSVEDKKFTDSFHLCANEWVVSWFFLVASSYISLRKNVNFFYGFRIDHAKTIFLSERTISNAENASQNDLKYEKAVLHLESSSVNDPTATNFQLRFSEKSGSSHGCSSKNPLTPLGSKCDSSTEISDLDTVSYWDSLLCLEEEDYEWISDSKPYECSSENPSTPTSAKCDSPSEISELDRISYWDSLLSLEEENCEWISDAKPELEYFRKGFPSPSSKSSWGSEVLPLVSTIPSVTGERSENNISAEHILETADMEEANAYEPLFWPFEGKFNWNSDESWSSFSMSPRKHMNGFSAPNKSVGLKLQEGNLELKKGCRRRLVFGSRSTTSRTNEWKQKGEKSVCSVKSESSRLSMSSKSSAKAMPLGSKDDKDALKYRVVPCIKQSSAGKTFLKKDFASNKELPMGRDDFAFDQELPIETMVGLKEFDGHEGLDSEFNDVFTLDESF